MEFSDTYTITGRQVFEFRIVIKKVSIFAIDLEESDTPIFMISRQDLFRSARERE